MLPLAAGSVPATAITLVAMSYFDLNSVGAARAISTVLGVMLLITAGALLFRRRLVDLGGDRLANMPARQTRMLTILTGVILGVLVTISSVGAGAIGVTVLLLLYPKLPMARIVGSDIAHAVPLTLVAGLGHWRLGSVDLPMLASLLTGSIPGIVLGSLFAVRVPDAVLRPVMAVTLAVVGGTLVFAGLGPDDETSASIDGDPVVIPAKRGPSLGSRLQGMTARVAVRASDAIIQHPVLKSKGDRTSRHGRPPGRP